MSALYDVSYRVGYRVGGWLYRTIFDSPLTIALAAFGLAALVRDVYTGDLFSKPTTLPAEVEWVTYGIMAFFLVWMALLLWQGRKLLRGLARDHEVVDESDISGECRIDPADGNAYFVRSMRPIVPGLLERGFAVTINDARGGHEREIDADEWVGWERYS